MPHSAEVQLSGPTTPLVKFGWPLGGVGLASYYNFLALTGSPRLHMNPGVAPVWGKAFLLCLLLVGLFFTYTVSIRLKKVWLNADGIRASNYLREEAIEWPDVRRVVIRGAFEGRRSPIVELELWRPHPFRGRISLLPASEQLLAELTGRAAAFGVQVEHRSA